MDFGGYYVVPTDVYTSLIEPTLSAAGVQNDFRASDDGSYYYVPALYYDDEMTALLEVLDETQLPEFYAYLKSTWSMFGV